MLKLAESHYYERKKWGLLPCKNRRNLIKRVKDLTASVITIEGFIQGRSPEEEEELRHWKKSHPELARSLRRS